jgi:hypothetical protein
MAKDDAKTKAAKRMLEAEESGPSKVSMGQIRAAEEEQRMGRRGMDTGKKKKKIPSDPIEHIRTLYGTGEPNDKVKKARKRLPLDVDKLIRGEKMDRGHKKDRETALSAADQIARDRDKRAEKYGKERSEYAKTGKSRIFDELEHVRRNKQSDPSIAGHLENLAQYFGAESQKAHERHQKARLGDAQWYDNVTPEEREYTEELMAWRKKHGKKGKK